MDMTVLNASGALALGQRIVISVDGTIKILDDGQPLQAGDVVLESQNGSSEPQISVKRFSPEDGGEVELDQDIADIFAALEEGQDPTELGEEFATAAGESGSSLVSSGTIERDGDETIPGTEFVTTGFEALGMSRTQSLSLLDAFRSVEQPNNAPTFVDNNNSPVGDALSFTTDEDTPVNGTLSASDEDGDSLSFTKATDPSNGTVVVDENGDWTYTPNENYNGDDSFTVVVSDDQGGTDTITVNVGVTPVNDLPVGDDISVTTDEDTPVSGSLTATDADNDQLTFSKGTEPSNGSVVVDENGNWTYTPDENYNGSDSFTVVVDDGQDGTDTITVDVGVTPVNDTFVDADESINVAEDSGENTGNVLTGTSSPDGDVTVTTFSVGNQTVNAGESITVDGKGTISIDSEGNYTFTPVTNYNGAFPTVTYTMTDGLEVDGTPLETSTLDLTVTPVNDTFVDADESINVAEDSGENTGNVLTGTSSPDGDVTVTTFSVGNQTVNAGESITVDGKGTISIDSEGNYTFTPVTNYNGAFPTVTYTMTDGLEVDGTPLETSTLDLTVTPVNDTFVDADESINVAEDSGENTGNVLTGTSSPDGDVTVTTFSVGNQTVNAGESITVDGKGTISIDSEGNYTFTPVTNYNGAFPTVTYTMTDGLEVDGTPLETSTLDLTVTPVNDTFVDADESINVAEDSGENTGNVLTGTSSPDGDVTVTTFSVGNQTVNAGESITVDGKGTISIDSEGNYTFTPVTNYNGAFPTVTYTMTDGLEVDGTPLETSTLDLTVTPVNDTFVDADESINVAEDSGENTGNVLTGTSSPDGDVTVTTFSVGNQTVNAGESITVDGKGTISIDSEGNYTFTPVTNYNGAFPTVTYTMTDGLEVDGTPLETSTLDLTVTPVNDTFVDADESINVAEDSGENTGNVLTGTSSPDGDVTVTTFSVGNQTVNAGESITVDGKGTISIDSEGNYTFTPVTNYNGAFPTVTYTMTDGLEVDGTPLETSTLDLTVTPVNDTFVDADESINVAEDSGENTGNVLTGTSSPDGDVTVTTFSVGNQTVNAGESITVDGKGTISIDSEGNYTFTPVTNYNGAFPTVTYTMTDGLEVDGTPLETSTLDLTVTPVNDTFVDADESINVAEDSGENTGNVLTGTSSPDGDVTVTTFSVGNQTVNAGESITVDGKGTISIDSEGNYTFTPVTNYNGAFPTVTYTMTDGLEVDGTPLETSTLDLTVTPVNDTFVDADESINVAEDSGENTGNVLTGTSSPDGDVTVTTFSVGNQTVNAGESITVDGKGTISIDSEGNYTFTPVTNYNGAFPTVTYTMTDGLEVDGTPLETSTLDLTVTPVNDTFVDADESINVAEDSGENTGNVLTGTSSPDGDVTVTTFSVGNQTVNAGESITVDGKGTISIDSEGNYTFTPVTNYNGAFPTVTYTMTDGLEVDGTPLETSTLDLTVTPVNDTFVDADESINVAEDSGENTGNVLTGTSSPDGDVTVTTFSVGNQTVNAGESITVDGKGTISIDSEGNYTFTPVTNYNGAFPTVTYTMTDGLEVDGTPLETSTLDLTVTPVNDTFVDADESINVAEDSGENTGNVLTGTSSPDGDVTVTTFSVGNQTVNAGESITVDGKGTISIDSEGNYTFTPVTNYNGAFPTVTYTMTDGLEVDGTPLETSTLDLTVTPVNDTFVDADESINVAEDSGENTGNVLTGTSSPDGDVTVTTFSVGNQTVNAGESITVDGKGTISIDSEGNYTFTPVTNYNGAFPTVTYTMTDGLEVDGTPLETSTLDLTVTPVNDTFVDADESINVAEDSGENTGNVLTGTSSPDGDVTVTTFSVGNQTVNAGESITVDGKGTISIDSEGNYTFTPVTNYNGAFPTVTYTMTDGLEVDGTPLETSTLDLTVTPVNDTFVDADESINVAEDSGENTGNVLTGTSSPDGDVTVTTFSVGNQTVNAGESITVDGKGTISIDSEGNYTFTPVTNYNGAFPTVTYTMTDGLEVDGTPLETSTLDLTVTPVNDTFVDADESINVAEDSGENTGNVLTGTSSPDGDVTVTTFSVGNQTVNAGESITVDGKGTISIDSEGNYTFTPVTNYNGAFPTVTYTMTDGLEVDGTPLETSTLDLTVTPVNDTFVDADESINVAEDSGENTGNVLTGTSSPDGDVTVTTFSVGNQTVNAGESITVDGKGTISIDSEGNYTFTPVTNYNGAFPTVTYTMTDGLEVDGTPLETSTLDLTVTPVNDTFVDADESINVAEDSGENTGNVLTGTSSPDGDVTVTTFSVGNQTVNAGESITVDGKGTISIDSEGNYTFTPVTNYNGAFPTVTYTMTDGLEVDGTPLETSTLDLTVTPVNDTFVDADESINVAEDSGENTGNVLTGTSSPDGDVTVTTFSVGNQTVNAGESITVDGKGTISIDSEGNYTFTPVTNYNGAFPTVTYTMTDGLEVDGTPLETSTLDLTVTPVNDTFVDADESINVAEDSGENTGNVLTGTSSPDGDVTVTTFSVGNQTVNAGESITVDGKGTISIDSEGNYTFTPVTNYNGAFPTVTYTMTDGLEVDGTPLETSTLDLTVTPVNDTFVDADESINVAEDSGENTGNVLTGTSSPDGDVTVTTFSVGNQTVNAGESITVDGKGTISIDSEGNYTFTPVTNYNGAFPTVTYTMTDGLEVDGTPLETSTLDLTVTPVNDTFVDADESINVAEDSGENTGNVLTGTSSPDGDVTVTTFSVGNQTVNAGESITVDGKGTISIDSEGNYTFTPVTNYNGAFPTVTYTMTDGLEVDGTPLETSTLDLTVTPVNDTFVDADESINVAEDSGENTGNVLTGTSSPDGDVTVTTFSVGNQTVNAGESITVDGKGTISIDSEGNYTFTPVTNYNGAFPTVTYTMTDGLEVDGTPLETSTLDLTVTPVNDTFVDADESINVAEDSGENTGNVLTGTSSPDGDVTVTTFSVGNQTVNAGESITVDGKGTISIDSEGNYTFTPVTNYNGAFPTVTYTMTDGLEVDGTPLETSTLDLTVTPVNDTFVDADESINVAEDSGENTGNVLTGTSSPDGDVTVTTFSVGNQTVNAGESITVDGKGTISIDSEGNYTFTPVTNYNGAFPTVTYTMTDGLEVDGTPLETSTLDLTVTPVNDTFVDADESINVAEDSGENTGNVLTGTSSPDGDVTVTTFSVGNQTVNAGESITVDGKGTISIDSEGNYTFTPVTNYNGAFPTVTYTMTDGLEVDGTPLETSTLDLTVTPVNDTFVDADESINVAEDSGENTGNVLTGTSSPDGDVTVTTFSVGNQTVNAGESITVDGKGTISIDSEGNYTFTPVTNYNGAFPTVTYTMTDGLEVDGTPLETSTLDLTVTPVNDTFVDADESINVAEDSGENTGNVLTGTSSPDGDVTVTTFSVGNQTVNAGESITVDGKGTISIDSEGNYTFTPVTNYNGAFPTVTYTMTDGLEVDGTPLETSTLDLTVTPVNDTFVDADESINVAEDSGENTGNVLTGTSSPDGDVTVTTFSVGNQTVNAGESITVDGKGTISIDSEGNYTFTPVTNYNGAFPTVTYTMTDGLEVDGTPLETSTLDLTVTPVNDTFVDADESINVAEDSGENTGNVLTGTSSPDGDVTVTTFSVGNQTVNAGESITVDGKGTISIDSEGNYTFTPVTNYNGAFPTVTYTMTDGLEVDGTPLETSTLDLTVTPVNDTFVDADESINVAEDSGENTGNVLTGTSSPDGDVTVTTFSVGNQTVNAGESITVDGKGTISIDSEGNYTFTPVTNYNGAFPTVTYTMTDGLEVDGTPLETSTLDLTVTPVNDTFVDADESINVAEDSGENTGNVLTGTSSPDGDVTVTTFSVGNQTVNAGESITVDGKGTISIDSEGNYTFTPVTNYNGAFPTVTYTMTDGLEVDGTPLETSTLDLTVTPVNDTFVDADESINVAEDSGENTGNVLTGTSSPDGDVTVTTFSVGNQTVNAGESITVDGKGTISIDSEGNYTFTPVTNYNGAFPTVTYTMTDGLEVDGTPLETSTLDLTVTPVNDTFVDADESINVAEDSGENTGNVLTGTSSPDGDVTVTTFSVGNQTVNAGESITVDGKGTISIDSEGNYTFTPVTNYNGAFPTVTYTMTDGLEVDGTPLETSTLDLTVTPVNDTFVDADESINVAEDSGENTGNVLTGTSSPDGDVTVTTFSVGNQTVNAGESITVDGKGTISIDSEGNYTFTPVTNYNGAFPTVTYTMTDGLEVDGTPLETSTLDLTVTPVNDTFVDADESINVAEDSGENTGNVLTGTSSPDGDVTVTTFSVGNQTVNAGESITVDGKGTISIDSEGNYTFTPVTNYNGAFPTVTYTMTDGLEVDGTPLETSTLDLTVTPVNDTFVDADESINVAEDSGENTGNVLTGTSSPDGDVTVTTFSVGNQTVNAGESITVDGKGTISIDSEGNYTFTPVTNYNGAFPTVTYTMTDGLEVDGTPLETSTLDLTVTPVNDGPTIDVVAKPTFNENDAAVDTVVATFTASDEEDGTPSVAFTPGTNTDSYYAISGTDVVLTQAGVDAVNAGETLPAVSLTATDSDNATAVDSDTPTYNSVDAIDDGSLSQEYTAFADFTDGITIPTGSDGEPLFSIEAITYDSDGNETSGTISELSGFGIGVAGSIRDSGQIADQIEYDPGSDTSEKIKFEFSELANNVDFSVSRLFGSENEGEQGAWSAYYNGELVASGVFKTDSGASTGDFNIDTGDIVFDTLVFEADSNGVRVGDSSDYVLSSIRVTGIDLGDGAIIVDEDDGVSVTDANAGLLANDIDDQNDTFSLTAVNGQTITNGSVVTLPSGALLTVYADGTYDYDTNDVYDYLQAGELTTESFTYTITDEHGATDTATATINIIGSNDAPSGNPDTATLEEGSTVTFTSDQLLVNDVDNDDTNLAVLSLASDSSGTNEVDISSPGSTFSTSLGGTVTINDDGSFSYQAPQGQDHTQGVAITDSIYYLVTDGQGNSNWTEIEIAITDSGPTAVDDFDSVGFGGLGFGNLISGENDGSGKDDLGSDVTKVTSITFDGQTYNEWNSNGEIVIDTGTAIATFNQDGSYSYQSTQAEGQVELFSTNDMLNNNGIELYAYSDYQQVDVTNLNSNSASVVNVGNKVGIYYDNAAGNGSQIRYDEALVTKFSGEVSVANFTLNGVANSEQVFWEAYDDQGSLIDSGTVSSNDLTIVSDSGFETVVLYTGTTNNFMVESVEVQYSVGSTNQDTFEYELTDADGSGASAQLTVTQDSLPVAKDNSEEVYEAGLESGTDSNSDTSVVTGNILDNDSGVSSSTSISAVNGQASVNGVVVITTTYGTLTVYTDDSNGFRAGDFEYELTNTSIGDDVVDSFSYTISNSVGVTDSAQLNINIVDDVPIVSDVERNLTTTSDPITTNLTFVLDLSGSMDYSAGNGKSYLETAIEALTALVSEVDDTGDVNVQIVTFSGNNIANSGWLLDDVADVITYLESLQASGGTLYSDALEKVMDSGALPTSDQSFVYFISDGAPNAGAEVDGDLQDDWNSYLDSANYDISFAIGIGNAPLDELTPIAHSADASDNDSDYAVVVDDADDLTNTVLEYFDNNSISGDVKLFDAEGGILEGADGVSITSIVIDGIAYEYDASLPEITVSTALGGEFRINFDSGEYYYSIAVDRNVLNESEVIQVQVEDGDGDQDSLKLTLNIDYHATIDANVNNIITNLNSDSPLSIDTDYLTHSDAITSDTVVSSVASSEATVTLNGEAVILDNAESGDEFSYVIDGNGVSDSANVEVNFIDSSVLSGTQADDIIIGKPTNSIGELATITATVRSGNTYNNPNQYGFAFSSLAAGLSVMQISIDLSSIDNNAYWDISDSSNPMNQTESKGIEQTDNIWDAMNSDSSVLIANFVDGDFTSDDEFWFTFDTDSFGGDQGSSFIGASFEVVLNDGSVITGTYESDGNGGAIAVVQNYASELYGFDGDDVLVADNGNDLLDGGEGDDLLIGGLGNDILTGGDGDDLFQWVDQPFQDDVDTITDFALGQDHLDISQLLPTENSMSDLLEHITIEKVDNGGGDKDLVITISEDASNSGQTQTIVLDNTGNQFDSVNAQGDGSVISSDLSNLVNQLFVNLPDQ
ncbi:tandem-95 repeat protein [Vibrio echinoideorum]|uniref:tandem-95 repeat protein n=1 Tax=Vibrio echinoideorum TaxID=2100116 RepID=UPI0021C49829|nr:Ig-like domain-containing protein [Vibrio echinoideorum]